MQFRKYFFWLSVLLLCASCSREEESLVVATQLLQAKHFSTSLAQVEHNPERNLLWGDLHVHTALSYDSYTMGTRALPDDAYIYMKGGEIQHGLGFPIRASRPLNFGAVTDHVEYLGIPRFLAGDDRDHLDGTAAALLEKRARIRFTAYYLYRVLTQMGSAETREENFGRDDLHDVSVGAWKSIVNSAERHYEPGRFTTFVAYEWSSMPNERNLHRNVIYESVRAPQFPFSSRDSENPEDLWKALDEQREQGMGVLAIPHNGNVSGGRMYERSTFDGERLNMAYAQTRNRNEPLSEIFQIKGASETHPQLSPDDEFSGFEIMDKIMSAAGELSQPKGSYARDALRAGLEFSQREGFNPFQFGVIGSSDSHNASAAPEEDNYHGKFPLTDGTAAQRLGLSYSLERLAQRVYGASGLVAVWAEENTRESIFSSMQRREVYATSGPRIMLRFFAGFEYPEINLAGDWLAKAYAGGVPMGAELSTRENDSPKFILFAMKDPLGANLDRLQVVKVWVDASGTSHEKVFNVAASGERMTAMEGNRLPPVGDTVDVESASYTNTIGSALLSVVWQDPEYDPSHAAAYYARAIEIPTPRYSTYDAKLLDVAAPEPQVIQERAVSSAIWLTPMH